MPNIKLKLCPFINAMQDIHDYLLESVKPWDIAHSTIYNIVEPLLKDADGACVNSRPSVPLEVNPPCPSCGKPTGANVEYVCINTECRMNHLNLNKGVV